MSTAFDVVCTAKHHMKRTFNYCVLLIILSLLSTAKLSEALATPSAWKESPGNSALGLYKSRRFFVATALCGGLGFLTQVDPSLAQGDVEVVVEKRGERIGLELYDVTIGTPPRSVVAVRRIVAAMPKNYKLQAQDALDLARRTSSVPEGTGSLNAYGKTVLSGPATCKIQSRRLDVLEIMYEARIASSTGIIYDSSKFRGTGRPYQMVLGSGDMLPGVDQGLYDMCPGEMRLLQIPPVLGYGSRGNKMFQIPPDSTLFWKVKLVSINSVREGDPRTRDDMEGRAEYY